MGDYQSFVERKLATVAPSGLPRIPRMPPSLFPHQQVLTGWALRRGRSAIFADTGLGKSRMELAWADAVRQHTGLPVLVLAPLAVAAQTADEGRKIGLRVNVCRDGSDVDDRCINITNYDRLHRFDPAKFSGVVLDESSIIKHHDAKTFSTLTEAFRRTPYKLAATATPAPNDWTELGTHAEFLGICTRQEMLAEFFTHDGGDTSVWRLKGHARQQFWRWVVSWGALIRKPSDLGYDDGAYNLPPLHLHEHQVEVDMPTNGMLFAMEAQTLSERREARRMSMEDRVRECAKRVNAEAGEPWVEIRGSDDVETKEARLHAFATGKARVLVSKPSICGWGLNWQHSARMAFVGVTDSYEAFYQAVRRSWRFGQHRDVHVHIFSSKAEGAIVANLKRKEREASQMAESLSAETRDAVIAEVTGLTRQTNSHEAHRAINVPHFLRVA
jgi:hypothetical protein